MTKSIFRLAGLLLLLCLSACGGGKFAPSSGPFSGNLSVAGSTVGNFTFTITGNLIGGTATLKHNSQDTVVAISGLIAGRDINGTLTNVNLGTGPFTGSFASGSAASGTFSYTDAGQVSTQTGTWIASISGQ